MTAILVRALIFFAVGIALGVAQVRSLKEQAAQFQKTGERARPTLVFVFWLFVLSVVFVTLGRSGPGAFVPSMLGYLLARLWGSARKNEPPKPSF